MCLIESAIGDGEILKFQIMTFFVIIATGGAWVYVYVRNNLGKELWFLLLPILLWLFFGTLDAIIAVRGTFYDPLLEPIPVMRSLFVYFGSWGALIASFLWISFWAAVVYAINKLKPGELALFASLAIFYPLAINHFFAFSAWFIPFCRFSNPGILSWALPLTLAALHCAIACGASNIKKGIIRLLGR